MSLDLNDGNLEENHIVQKNNTKLLFDIFITFFKIGSVTFGGVYNDTSNRKEVISNKGWIKNDEEIIDVFVVSESIPGAIAINSSTFVGYKIAEKWCNSGYDGRSATFIHYHHPYCDFLF